MIYPWINYSSLEEVKKEVERLSFLHSYKVLEDILNEIHDGDDLPRLIISDHQNYSRFSYEFDKEVVSLNVICDYDKDILKELTIHFFSLGFACGTYHIYFLQNKVVKAIIDDAKAHHFTEEYYIQEEFVASKTYVYSPQKNTQRLIQKNDRQGNEIYERNYLKRTSTCTHLINGKPEIELLQPCSRNQFEKRHQGIYKRIRKLGYEYSK